MGGGLSWASRPGKSRPTSKLPDSTAATLSVSSSSHFAAVVEGRRAAPPPLPIGHRKKNILFSTATTSSDHHEGSQDKEKMAWSRLSVSMLECPMLEVAHENDIELEGYRFIITTVLRFEIFYSFFADNNI
uniref:Uncharacterized protein n=1 Tax=Oryza glumipatula TaxID=40148 RepID=A0A0E0A696_9ORYZ